MKKKIYLFDLSKFKKNTKSMSSNGYTMHPLVSSKMLYVLHIWETAR